MRTIETTTRFRQDYKREKKGQFGKRLDALLEQIVNRLAADATLAPRFRDHPMTGDWGDHRDCVGRDHGRAGLLLRPRQRDDFGPGLSPCRGACGVTRVS